MIGYFVKRALLVLLCGVLLLAGCGSSTHISAPTPGKSVVAPVRGLVSENPSSLPQVSMLRGTPSVPVVGDVFNTTTGTWGNCGSGGSSCSYTYQWRTCNSSGTGCSNLGASSGAEVPYTVVSGDVGHTIRSQVTATNSAGNNTQTSAQTGVVTSGGGGTTPFVDGVCSPSPCTNNNSATGFTVTAADSTSPPQGNAISSPANLSVPYHIGRPGNLSTSTQVPAVVVTCGSVNGNPNWIPAAATDKFVIIYWDGQETAGGGSSGNPGCSFQSAATKWKNNLSHSCGTGGNNECDSIPGLVAILNAVECSGAAPCQNINPNEVFITGASEGGQFAETAMCDTRTTHKFAGIQVISDLLVSPHRVNSGIAPSLANALPPNCPAMLQPVGAFCIADCVSATPNPNIGIQYVYGTADPVFGGSPPTNCALGTNCLGNGFYYTANPDWWFFGNITLGQTTLGSVRGCPSSPAAVASSGSPNPTGVQTSTYTPCSSSSSPTQAAIQLVQIAGAGHLPDTWPTGTNLNGSDGMETPATAWAFWHAYFH